jgi:hypothetical protein
LMTTSDGPCDPVDTAASGCTAGSKCTIAGSSRFGPRLYTHEGARCVVSQSVGSLGAPCMPGVSDTASDDTCAPGLVCMDDVSDDQPHCQALCHTDAECANNQLGRQRCMLIVDDDSTTSTVGVCMASCSVEDDGNSCAQAFSVDMSVAYSVSCHFGSNLASTNNLQTQGYCSFDGMEAYGAACANTSYADTCEAGYVCVGSVCEAMCDAKSTSECGGSTCTPIIKGDPTTDGWCMQEVL